MIERAAQTCEPRTESPNLHTYSYLTSSLSRRIRSRLVLRGMSLDDNKVVVHAFAEAISSHDLTRLDSVIGAQYVQTGRT